MARIVSAVLALLASLAVVPRAHACGGGGGSWVGEYLYDPALGCGADGCVIVYQRDELHAAHVGWDDRVEALGRPYPDDLGFSTPLDVVAGKEGYLLLERLYVTDAQPTPSLIATVLGSDGRAIGPHLELAPAGGVPAAAWDGSAWVVAWSSPTQEATPIRVTMARIGGDGRLLGNEVVADGAWDGYQQDLVAVASSGGITWVAWSAEGSSAIARGIVGVRYGADGSRLDPTPRALLEDANRPRLAAQAGRFYLLGDDFSTSSAHGLGLDGVGPTSEPQAIQGYEWATSDELGVHPLAGDWVITYSASGWGDAGMKALRLASGDRARFADGNYGRATTFGDRLVAATVLWNETLPSDTAQDQLLLSREEPDRSRTIVTVDETTLHWQEGCTIAAGRGGAGASRHVVFVFLGLVALASLGRRSGIMRPSARSR